jgi:murein DD-endopeptidase MepM/ murein hydrolase activator NlpD
MRAKIYVVHFLISVLALLAFTKNISAQNSQIQTFIPAVSSSKLESSEEDLYEAKYAEIEKLLVEKLQNSQYTNYSYNWTKQDENWIYGYILASVDESTPPDGYNFLVNLTEGKISVAYMYTEEFDQWIDLLPESIISHEDRKFFYSSTKSSQMSEVTVNNADDPQLSFPWREGYSWRFNGGPHNNSGEGHHEIPWSGIDFGIPYKTGQSEATDTTVVTSHEGFVLIVEPKCSVTIGFENGWSLRYLHITDIKVFKGQYIERGSVIANVNTSDPCFLGPKDGPHLHLGLKKDGDFVDFDGKYIGGWQVKNGSDIYQGTLTLGSIVTLPASTTRIGKGSSYVENKGFIGSNWFIGPVVYKKPAVGVGICGKEIACYQLNTGSIMQAPFIKQVTHIMPSKGYIVEFKQGNSAIASESSTNSTNASGSCLDFDITDLQNYNFPGTSISLRENSSEIIVQEGTCNPADRPIKTGSTTAPGTPPSTEQPTNYGCSSQTTGVKFLNNSGSCFYMTAGKTSLPFSPTKIQILDTVRKYDISICNSKGQCDEFNNTADIDHSSVSRPFTRVEVTPQGLVSSDAIGSCKTSSGRAVQFSTMQASSKYYTDRSYTVKNVDKVELIGMKFLMTPNDDKMNGDPEYITCDIKQTTQIVIAIDRRVRALPSWMRGLPYERMNREIGVTDNEMQHFDLYACTQKGGYKLRLGGPQSDGSNNVRSNYIIVFRSAALEKATDCSAKFNVPPDLPVLKEISTTELLSSAPLLEWTMSDRNFTDDYLQAYVKIWKGDELISPIDWLPIGVTQWIPLWNDVGQYKAQVIVRDSKGLEIASNLINYQISATPEACVAVAPLVFNK